MPAQASSAEEVGQVGHLSQASLGSCGETATEQLGVVNPCRPHARAHFRRICGDARRWLRRAAALGFRGREESVGAVFAFDRPGELGRDLGEVGVRAGNRAHAAPFADAVEFGDSIVESLPQLLGSAAPGVGLQLVGWFRAAARGGPFVSLFVGHLAGGSSSLGGLGKGGDALTEAGIGRREDVLAQGGAPYLSSLLKFLLGVHGSGSEQPIARVRIPASGKSRLADEWFVGLVSTVLPRAFAGSCCEAAEAVDLLRGDLEAVADPYGLQPLGSDPVADRLVARAERVSRLGDGQEVRISHRSYNYTNFAKCALASFGDGW
jgi:hypothetical protein